ncbi:hypothetical protein BSKO_02639 [Bryopsis sp. KO-2023]|nr:hypothetical protein BSKO_02639 [Bryopsis sp. KO-2023]
MPFGLQNSPFVHMRMMDDASCGVPRLAVFVDDLCACDVRVENIPGHLKIILERVRMFKLRPKPWKCEVGFTLTNFIDNTLSEHGLGVDELKVEKLANCPKPVTKTQMLDSFLYLRSELTTTTILEAPDYSQAWLVDTDACDEALGRVLSPIDKNWDERIVLFHSSNFTKAERNYSVTEMEALALIDTLKKIRCYILGERQLPGLTTNR